MSDPYKRDRRLGRWFVSGQEMAQYPGRLEEIQRGVVILDIRRDWSHDRVEYIGRSDQFEIVPEGEEVPLYRPHVLAGEVRWETAAPIVIPSGFTIDSAAVIDWRPGSPIRPMRKDPVRRNDVAYIWGALVAAWSKFVRLRQEAGR